MARKQPLSTEPTVAAAAVAGPVGTPACATGEVALTSGGMPRRYVVTRPDATDDTRRTRPPILLLFHGYTTSAESVMAASQLPPAAVADGWVVVAPQGSGDPPRWALQSLPAPDDVSFVRDVIAHVARDGCADATRVAAVGYSNGAGFTATLTCELDLVASGLIAGANLGPTCRVPGHPVVIVHGDADDVVPISGGPVIGGALHAEPLVDTIDAWRIGGAAVTAVVVPGWDHGWPPRATETVLEVFATVG